MKPIKTKQQQSDELKALVEAFISEGGDVVQCDMGASGRDINQPLPKPPFVEKSEQTRTLVNEVVEAIESRKQSKKAKPAKRQLRDKSPQKQLLVDDFGEPLRWVWEEKDK